MPLALIFLTLSGHEGAARAAGTPVDRSRQTPEAGGARAVVAESVLMKHNLLVSNRAQRRTPKLSALDLVLLGFWSLFLGPRRIFRGAVIIRPSTLLWFHEVLKKRKSQLPMAA